MRPLYQRIADDIRAAITDLTYPPGSTLPSRAILAAHYHCTHVTVRTAMQQLEREGLVAIQQGRAPTVLFRPIQQPEQQASRFQQLMSWYVPPAR